MPVSDTIKDILGRDADPFFAMMRMTPSGEIATKAPMSTSGCAGAGKETQERSFDLHFIPI